MWAFAINVFFICNIKTLISAAFATQNKKQKFFVLPTALDFVLVSCVNYSLLIFSPYTCMLIFSLQAYTFLCLAEKLTLLNLKCMKVFVSAKLNNQPSMPQKHILTNVYVDMVCIYYSIAWFISHTNDNVIGYNKTNIKLM